MDAQQARLAAKGVADAIHEGRPGTVAAESPDGKGLPHALFLAERLSSGGPGIVPGDDRIGASVAAALAERHPEVVAERLPGGMGLAHSAFMCAEMARGMSTNKSLRWQGYLESMAAYQDLVPVPPPGAGDPDGEEAVMLALGRIQGIMVHEGVASLETEKLRNLAAVGTGAAA